MHALFQLQFWLAAVGGLLAVRQLALIAAAEKGRKHDLVRKLYKINPDFHVSILITYLDGREHARLLDLLQALAAQDYPAEQISIHLVTSEASKRELFPQYLQPNVKVWEYPAADPRPEHAISWLIERCLAAGGNGLFTFLRPTDMVKGDYVQNIVARGYDSFAIQGYVAQKNLPETPMGKALALSSRMFNRIGNAGRYHLGMSCRLLESGWAIKQEVLEMIPFHQGADLDNLEYSIRLNLENFRVNWAPNVVVYADADVHFMRHLTRCAGAGINRLRLLTAYGPKLLGKLVTRLDPNYFEQLLSIVNPPFMLGTFAMLLMGALSASGKLSIPGEPIFWLGLGGLFLATHLAGLFVARCRGNDIATALFWTPVVYALSLIALPVAYALNLQNALARRAGFDKSWRASQSTRFNEALDPLESFEDMAPNRQLNRMLEDREWILDGPDNQNEPSLPTRKSKRPNASQPASVVTRLAVTPPPSFSEGVPEREIESEMLTQRPARTSRQPREQVKSVPLSNGQRQVQCSLRTMTEFTEEGLELYQLTLEYKSMAFSTARYRILDQAFYELQSKLMGRGLTIVSCGSCGQYYNPTADVPGALKNSGVCLLGKVGREVNPSTDAVTVVSQACTYHCPLDQRESIVKQWKESLAAGRR